MSLGSSKISSEDQSGNDKKEKLPNWDSILRRLPKEAEVKKLVRNDPGGVRSSQAASSDSVTAQVHTLADMCTRDEPLLD